jgi:uncharacterized protein (DUF952 family)
VPEKLIYILCPLGVFKTAQQEGFYRAESLLTEGFIHASPATKLTRVANKYFSDEPELVVMYLEISKLQPALKWEPIHNGDLYPHLYGALNMDAVISSRTFKPGTDGQYRIEPEML